MIWLQERQLSSKLPNQKPEELGASHKKILKAWNMMGRQIDWSALPIIVEYLDVDDVEILIDGLLEIRNYQEQIDAMK